MIARLWRGRASDAAKADAYVRHFTGTVAAELKDLAGHRGAWLLRREIDGGTEFVALTLWESRQSIEAFAGPISPGRSWSPPHVRYCKSSTTSLLTTKSRSGRDLPAPRGHEAREDARGPEDEDYRARRIDVPA